MASRESIRVAELGGNGGGRLSPEALLVRVAGIDGAAAQVEASSADVTGGGGGGDKMGTVVNLPSAGHDGTRRETPYSVSFSVPSSPSGLHLAQLGVRMSSINGAGAGAAQSLTRLDVHPAAVPGSQRKLLKHARHHSQPSIAVRGGGETAPVPRSGSTRERDRRFDHFKTFSGRLERQLSNLRGLAAQDAPSDIEAAGEPKISEEDTDDEVPTADRYFAALEGPELDTLRATEVAALPEDEKWPFLLRFPISAFGMCLGVSSQAMLWKTLASEPSTAFLRVNPGVNHVLWWVSVALMVLVSAIYLLKVVFYFEAVRREFHHPIRVNFFFAPWIACLFLVKGVPRPVGGHIHHLVWCLLMAPIFILDLKIYGQWMSGGERRLSKVANPTSHLAVVGNFVGALLGAKMGFRELPIFFFAVGLAHYVVLFVTLYQRLPTNNVQLPKELHPIFFLFVAAPSVASMAWARISGEFNHGARLAYFISVFLYMSLVVRINLFRGFRFSLAWWAYTFPMTSVALATVLYASAVNDVLTRALAVGLSGIAAVTVAAVLAATTYHAFVLVDLFPNDVSIAITGRPKPRFSKILANLRSSSPDVLSISIPKHGGSASNSGQIQDDDHRRP